MDALVIDLAVGIGLQNAIGWFPPILQGGKKCVANVVPMLLALFFYQDKRKEYEKSVKRDSEKLADPSYDFIVVGAGSAGSIVANRLSKFYSVLLLERGGEPNPLTRVPGLEFFMVGQPEVDYNYLTVPQNSSCLSHINRQSLWNAGLGLGGTHNLNSMVYIRGHPFDYNLWASVTNDTRWKYENILPYFLRSEGYCENCDPRNGPKPSINPKFHNPAGELPVRPSPFSPLVPEFLEANEWIGVPKADFNSPYFRPVASFTERRGRRVTSYNAFISPIIGKRSTLQVVKYAHVIQVLFESHSNRVTGVEYEHFGKRQVARAKKEVILSAGAIASPKILLLSGIGPETHLNELKIPMRVDLPVGRNLQDHVGTLVGPFLIDKPVSVLPERDLNAEAVQAFLQNGTGPFSAPFARAGSLWTSSRALHSGEGNWPDIIVGMAASGISQNHDQVLSSFYNLKPEVMREFFDPIKGRDAFSLLVSFCRPLSRGVVQLQSTNYNDAR